MTVTGTLSWTFYSSGDTTVIGKNFQSDFFVLTHGIMKKTASTGAMLAAETAVWGYEQIRQRKYYWLDKKKLVQRILRSTNIALWQKQREHGCEQGVGVEGVCCIAGDRTIWVGCVGNATVYEKRRDGERRILGVANDSTQLGALGVKRYAWQSAISAMPFERGDMVLLSVGRLATQQLPIFDALCLAKSDEECKLMIETVCGKDPWGIYILKCT